MQVNPNWDVVAEAFAMEMGKFINYEQCDVYTHGHTHTHHTHTHLVSALE